MHAHVKERMKPIAVVSKYVYNLFIFIAQRLALLLHWFRRLFELKTVNSIVYFSLVFFTSCCYYDLSVI